MRKAKKTKSPEKPYKNNWKLGKKKKTRKNAIKENKNAFLIVQTLQTREPSPQPFFGVSPLPHASSPISEDVSSTGGAGSLSAAFCSFLGVFGMFPGMI